MNATKILWGQVIAIGAIVVLAFLWGRRNGSRGVWHSSPNWNT
jgi:nitrogen fixation-related uncharacterized protein